MSVIDKDELLEAVNDSLFGTGNDGFCIECGAMRGGCEPDARKYECWECGEHKVYGAEELLMMGFAE